MAEYTEDPLERLFRKSGVPGRTVSGERRGVPWGLLLFLFLVVVIISLSGVGIYTDWLWYSQDVQHPDVFVKTLSTKVLLWVSSFAVSFLVLNFFIARSLKASAIYAHYPESITERAVSQMLGFIQSFGRVAGVFVSIVLAFLIASAFSSYYQELWWYQNSVPFGVKDPLFNLDLGFYVFKLPWIQASLNFLFVLLVLCLIIVGLTYMGIRFLAALGNLEFTLPFSKAAISTLLGTALVVFGFRLWTMRYGFGMLSGPQFTGAGYASVQQLGLFTGVSVFTVALGVLTALNGFIGRPYRVLVVGGPVLLVVGFLGMPIYAAVVQRFVVEPNKIQVEKPYAERALWMTNYAYNLNKIRVKDFNVQPKPTSEELRAARTTLENMRLWDPNILKVAIDGLQGLRSYYRFPDVDIDRYQVNGQQKMVMISPRNMDTAGLPPTSQTWVQLRLQYTHGYGVVMSPVNEATPSGQPTFFVRDMPLRTISSIKIDQPRIYYSDFQTEAGIPTDPYVIVRTGVEEFDFPAQKGDQTYRWTGKGGVPVSGLLSKLAYSLQLKDGNLLISTNIREDSRLLYRRNIRERAELVYPMLQFDEDPYIVVLNGRLMWILDAYTSTDRIPYSQLQGYQGRRVNYIRNSVKVMIDAYDGSMVAYAADEKDPILQAYTRIFPGLIHPSKEIPQELRAHFRYAEDMLDLQAHVLATYHVKRPETFLTNEDVWEIPKEVGRTGELTPMLPYYVQIRLPDEERDAFMLILPFTPRGKPNMIGWMAAHCDPDRYGELVLYRFPENTQTPGPSQMEALFNQDREIADINRQFNNERSEIVLGNLLVIPIGSSILYVKPMFLQSRTNKPIPELKKVILGLQDQVIVADTYVDALKRLFGPEVLNSTSIKAPAAPAQALEALQRPVVEVSASQAKMPSPEVAEALRLLDQADAALRQGDFAKFGELQKQAREKLRKLTQPQ